MNLNIVNLPPIEWDKETWRDAYAQYCAHNMYGPKTKREYYDMVLERHARHTTPPLSDELRAKWVAGKRAAREWARNRGCDMNGRLLIDVARETQANNIVDMVDNVTSLQYDMDRVIRYIRQRK